MQCGYEVEHGGGGGDMGGFLGEGEMNCASWILTTVSFLEGKLGRGFEYFFNFHPILGVNDPI